MENGFFPIPTHECVYKKKQFLNVNLSMLLFILVLYTRINRKRENRHAKCGV